MPRLCRRLILVAGAELLHVEVDGICRLVERVLDGHVRCLAGGARGVGCRPVVRTTIRVPWPVPTVQHVVTDRPELRQLLRPALRHAGRLKSEHGPPNDGNSQEAADERKTPRQDTG